MTDGFALTPGAAAPRPRGRPKGSRNKRPRDLAGYVEATCGGTAALQLAKGCMVTLAEVKAAGSAEAAELAKARRRVEAFEREAAKLDQDLRSIVRQELAALVAQAEVTTKASAVLAMVAGAVDRMQDGRRLGLLGALDRMAEDRRALLPYTDQKQAQKVEVKDDRKAVVMILDTGSPSGQKAVEFQGPLIDVTPIGSHPKAHDVEEGEE